MIPVAIYFLSVITAFPSQDTTQASRFVEVVAGATESHFTQREAVQLGGPVYVNADGFARELRTNMGSAVNNADVRASISPSMLGEGVFDIRDVHPVSCPRSLPSLCTVRNNGIILLVEHVRRANGAMAVELMAIVNERQRDEQVRAVWARLRVTVDRTDRGWNAQTVELLNKGLVRDTIVG
jgi:hypothetical protein